MDDIRQRLTKCFQAAFPELPESDISSASPETVNVWDSVAAITLMTVVEEEFGVQIDLDDLAGLDSFENFYAYLQQRLQAS